MDRNERAPGDGALGELRVSADCKTYHAPDRPQGKARDRTSALLTVLRSEYPVLSGYRPLSLGIRAAVHAAVPGVTGGIVNCALASHSCCDNSLTTGGPRFDLDDVPSGEVSEEHRVAAVLLLHRRAKKAVKRPKPPRVAVAGAAPRLTVLLMRLAKARRRA